MLFEPRILFLLLWSMQGLGYLFIGRGFHPFDPVTWGIVGIAVLSFIIGGTTGSFIPTVSLKRNNVDKFGLDSIRLFTALALTAYIAVAGFTAVKLFQALISATNNNLTPSAIRLAVIRDFLGPREILSLLRVYFFGVGLCIYILAFARSFSKKMILFVFFIGLFSALATTGRLYLLLFFISSIALLYRQKILTLRNVFVIGFGFICLFFLLAILFKKGAESTDTLLSTLEWNAKVYILSSLGCFNDYIVTRLQHIDDGMLLPNPFRNLINDLFNLHLSPKPPLNPFSEVPVPCNTYTLLFPIYNDLGIMGIMVIMLLLGLLHRYLYRIHIQSKSPVIWYLYALSLYPLIMSIFEDAYFSSMGFWALLWIPFFSHYILHQTVKFLVIVSKS